MPKKITKTQIETVRQILREFGWVNNGVYKTAYFYHPAFASTILVFNSSTLTVAISSRLPASKGRLVYRGVGAIRSGLKAFHQLDLIPKSVEPAAKSDAPTVKDETYLGEQITIHNIEYLDKFSVRALKSFRCWEVEAVATDANDTDKVGTMTIARCFNAQTAELVKYACETLKRAELALVYLEDDAPHSALRVLKGGRQ